MKTYFRDKLKQGNEWIDGTGNYGLILTDDIDSLLSCAILKHVKGWNIEQGYIMNGNKRDGEPKPATYVDYYGETVNAAKHEQIGVDLALVNGKCFDNHVSIFSAQDHINAQSVNLNRTENVTRENYWQKYNLSTVLLLWSLYDLPKEGLSDELMMLLIAIDASFAGFYSQGRFGDIHKHYLVDILDLPEFYECEKRHKRDEFIDIIKKYRISGANGKIKFGFGHLKTGIDLAAINETLAEVGLTVELPADEFKKKGFYVDNATEIGSDNAQSIYEFCKNPFCYALTRKGYLNYSEVTYDIS